MRQFPRKLKVTSPGSLPAGVTPENILDRQVPRNRRIAEALSRCGLVERSGQGMDLIFGECIRESKPRPSFDGSDEYQVSICLDGKVQDPRFLRFLEQLGRQRQESFDVRDLVVLDLVRREEPVPDQYQRRLNRLRDMGAIELAGRRRHILSRSWYRFLGKKGVYTRKRGLGRDKQKELLLQHIVQNRESGSCYQEFAEIFPELNRNRIRSLLRNLKKEGKIRCQGQTRGGKWFPLPPE